MLYIALIPKSSQITDKSQVVRSHRITSEGNLQQIFLPYSEHSSTYVHPTVQQEQDSSLIITSFTKCMKIKVMSVSLSPYFLEKGAKVLNKAPQLRITISDFAHPFSLSNQGYKYSKIK